MPEVPARSPSTRPKASSKTNCNAPRPARRPTSCKADAPASKASNAQEGLQRGSFAVDSAGRPTEENSTAGQVLASRPTRSTPQLNAVSPRERQAICIPRASFLSTKKGFSMATVGRPRLPSPERKARQKASKQAWAERNQSYVRRQIRALASRPEYVERRRMLRHKAVLAAGGIVRPPGRPPANSKLPRSNSSDDPKKSLR